MLKEKAPKVFTTLQQQLQTGTIHLKSRIFFFLYFGIVILTFEQKLTQSTASCMQFELKASMCESSTKLIPYMLITLKFGVALFNVLIFRSSYFSFVLFWLFLPDVEHLVDLPLLFLTLLIGSIKVEHLDPVDEVVDLLHEVVKEDRLAETHAQVLDLKDKFEIEICSLLGIQISFLQMNVISDNEICKYLNTFVGKALSSEKSASWAP